MKVLFAGMTTSPIRSCPVHSHTSFEMILTLSGTGTAGAGPRRTSFEPGTVLVVPPGMPHFTDAEGYFEDIFVQLEEPRWPRGQCLVLRDYKGDMKKLMTMLYENYVQREAGYEQLVESLMHCLYQYVDKYTRDRFRFPFVRELMDILTGNLGNSGLSIPAEAARLGVSFEYLRHCFKQDTGTTPLAYLTMMRASDRTVRGLELLQQGTSKIMLDIIKAQQAAEELLLNQPTDPASQNEQDED